MPSLCVLDGETGRAGSGRTIHLHNEVMNEVHNFSPANACVRPFEGGPTSIPTWRFHAASIGKQAPGWGGETTVTTLGDHEEITTTLVPQQAMGSDVFCG